MSRSLSGYQSIRDMIDGGGAGTSGPEFQGGGTVSDIANALFDPLGSRMPQPQQARPQPVGPPMSAMQPMSAIPPMSPMMNPAATPPTMPQVERMTPATAYQPYQPYQPAQPQAPSMSLATDYGPSVEYGPSVMPFEVFVAGLGPEAQSAPPEVLMRAYQQFLMGY